MTFQNKKILVAGLGGTGISMIAYLRKNGAEVAAYDAELKPERVSQIGKMFDGLVFYTGRLKDALDNGFDILALSPGISERQPDIEAFKQNGGRVLGDIELLADIVNRRGDKVIAITGSNGKTTVTSLVGYLCIKCGLDTVIAAVHNARQQFDIAQHAPTVLLERLDIWLTLADAGTERQNIETIIQRIFQTARIKHQPVKHLTDLRHALRFQLRIIRGNLRAVFAQVGNHRNARAA